MNTQPVNAGIRIATMLLDHVFMTFIAMLFYLPVFFGIFAMAISAAQEEEPFNPMSGASLYIAVIGFAIYFCKDCFKGRSLAKRILKLQLVDHSTGAIASPLQCFVRNLFCIIWPVEVIMALVNPSRRIGDHVAGTRLEYFDPAIHQGNVNTGKIILSFILSYALFAGMIQLFPSPNFGGTQYSKTSYNESASKELEQLITDKMIEYLTPTVKVYDSVHNSRLKYVSAIMTLHENYLEDEGNYRQLHEMITRIIYDKLGKETFTGRIQYIFRSTGQWQSRTTNIGTNH